MRMMTETEQKKLSYPVKNREVQFLTFTIKAFYIKGKSPIITVGNIIFDTIEECHCVLKSY
jgi:hypothetical protein